MKWNDVLILVVLGILLILGFGYINREGLLKYITIEKTDTVISTKIDTFWRDTVITEKEFVPKYIVKTKIDTLFKSNGDTVQLVTESKRFDKTLISGKDTADVEIYTTGVETSLDSLKMRLKTYHEVVTNTVEITKEITKYKKVNIGLQGGYGYGFKSRQFEPYIGVGISVTF